ncbi:MAG: cytochrome c biogenesis protein CcsA, partial [Chloroflexota bacterium]|nr:cytochrome c biogenesis protein CcsA [Chloroflexota bacterium]
MSELGYIALLLAFAASIYALVASVLGARGGYAELSTSARNGVLAVCGLVSLAALALFYALLTNDFSLEYVASYTSRDMEPVFIFSAFWAGNAGSLLFWAWAMSGFAAVVILQHWRRLGAFMAYVSAILMGIVAFFLGGIILLSNPFLKLASIPPDGRGLNPLLENMGMFFHPPTTLLGYAAFAVPFAFAMAALITRRSGDDWIRLTRRWTLFAWFILGAGNLFGAQWAYVELGWGGLWAWDPVENASLMPWLVGTAFLHSAMI